ncbi:TetR family transcriptional regulator [Nocardioides marmoriginsengisoli]|uniref:TetR family transcriptional regulator n=1 Tax=Nocardioides marmoriginsengisoli TaxID=661483 RepID=A0A3N0CP93_9ACTN|nr:TetR family transcriptional regulator [Nocardioides marmoriginsengisoli]RNL65278.1 TetR family transcriptional regulator [Nocardioides marmoriginsengisoli]
MTAAATEGQAREHVTPDTVHIRAPKLVGDEPATLIPVTETTPPESRSDKKERTRRAILDAALTLTEDTGLAGLSLRQVAKEVGIVPTAFYRHFDSIDQLGLALVEESFGALRAMIRDTRQGSPSLGQIVDRSVDVLAEHVRDQRAHFGFIAREKSGGSAPVRDAVRREFAYFERELATDLARLPMEHWSADDLRILSNLIVGSMIATSEEILRADPRDLPDIKHRARTQLLMVIVGALNWKSSAPS